MVLRVVGIMFCLIFYFHVFLEYFKMAFEKLFYLVDLFKNFLYIIINNIRNMKILYFILIILFLCVVDKGTGDSRTKNNYPNMNAIILPNDKLNITNCYNIRDITIFFYFKKNNQKLF